MNFGTVSTISRAEFDAMSPPATPPSSLLVGETDDDATDIDEEEVDEDDDFVEETDDDDADAVDEDDAEYVSDATFAQQIMTRFLSPEQQIVVAAQQEEVSPPTSPAQQGQHYMMFSTPEEQQIEEFTVTPISAPPAEVVAVEWRNLRHQQHWEHLNSQSEHIKSLLDAICHEEQFKRLNDDQQQMLEESIDSIQRISEAVMLNSKIFNDQVDQYFNN